MEDLFEMMMESNDLATSSRRRRVKRRPESSRDYGEETSRLREALGASSFAAREPGLDFDVDHAVAATSARHEELREAGLGDDWSGEIIDDRDTDEPRQDIDED